VEVALNAGQKKICSKTQTRGEAPNSGSVTEGGS